MNQPASPPPAPLPPTPPAPLPTPPLTPLADLRADLEARLPAPARAWLRNALDEATAHAETSARPDAPAPPASRARTPLAPWELRLAEARRRCGSAHADTARLLLLCAADADLDVLARVYAQGTADERRAVLSALPYLVPGPEALPLVHDALRTNDTRLLAAAVGPYGARHLDVHSWRHAVLKCLFTGVSVDAVAALAERARADAELARMLRDYAAERTAADRPVPGDLHRVLALTEPAAPAARTAAGAGRLSGTHLHSTGHPHGKES
ncbi:MULTISPECIES: EboA domain-containing protein [unclassified Streptomyces]|uniref:EboA domain-containing protein n=1 Tax=unclassified Streptomyces TaxID=2593676 RepID=UPI003822B564